jgi:hypothetical protein
METIQEKDMIGVLCEVCKKGHYKETRLQDDWDGVLHCDKCDHQVNRYKKLNGDAGVTG